MNLVTESSKIIRIKKIVHTFFGHEFLTSKKIK